MPSGADNPYWLQPLREALFGNPELRAYAVLDGASVPRLPRALWEQEPEHVCLYAGQLQPDLLHAAPYLVALAPDHPFSEWVLKEGWGKHWGIFALAPAGCAFRELRKHFRKFLMIKSPQGESLYFRYYDPRVLQAFLPSCDFNQLGLLFGPATEYLLETRDGAVAWRFSLCDGCLQAHTLELKGIGVRA